MEQIGCLYDADQGVQKQGHSAGAGALLQQKAEPAAEAQAVQQGGAEQHDGTGNSYHRGKLEARVVNEYAAEQKLGQGRKGNLEYAGHGHGGEGPPESEPPGPPGPQRTAQRGAEGADPEADEILAGEGIVQQYVECAGNQRGWEQGGQFFQLPPAALIQDGEQVGCQHGVGQRGI